MTLGSGFPLAWQFSATDSPLITSESDGVAFHVGGTEIKVIKEKKWNI